MTNYKYSIIVPVFMVGKYLDRCVQSLINQTYQNIEIILVDDGSPDNCPEICEFYAATDSRVKVIHKENGGLVSARQAGIKVASGDYICCVDGDDYVSPDMVSKIAETIAQYDAEIVCFNLLRDSLAGTTAASSQLIPGCYDRAQIEKSFFPFLLENEQAIYFPPSLCAKAFQIDLYREWQNKVLSCISIGEDRAVTIPCIYNCKRIVILGDYLYYYCINDQSMTKRKAGFSWVSLAAFACHLSKRIDLSQYDFQAQYDRLIAHQFFLTAKSQFNRDEPYHVIRREILEKMNDPVFSESIKQCHFGMSFRAKLMEYCLKMHLVWPMWLYSKVLS